MRIPFLGAVMYHADVAGITHARTVILSIRITDYYEFETNPNQELSWNH